jgi:peptidyl-prolyl cis-trans isomerase D
MLDAMRRGALNWAAKGLLALLVVAFAVWGIGDVVRNVGRDTLATVGSTQITPEQFRQAYQDELTSFSRRLGRRLTIEQAKMLGIEQRALSRLIGTAAIEQHAKGLGLALSDAGIADLIRNDAQFHGADGKFSNRVFQNTLRQAGLNEARYVSERRREEVRDQITDTLLSGLAPPQWQIEQLFRYREETRVLEYFTPDYDKLIKVAEPDEAKLKEQYEQNKRQFVTPELRKINLLLLSRDAVKSRIAVSDEDVKTAYDNDKDKYNIPEKRRIQQLSFPDRAAAEKAYAELSKAKDFKEAAVKLGFKETDFDIGLMARRDMIDPKIAEAAFTLKKDELSKPVEGQFTVALLRVSEIVPAKQRPFDEVKGEIKDRIAADRAGEEIRILHDKVEDMRGTGTPLKEIGEGLKLPFREIADLERSGKTPDGKPTIEGADPGRIAQAAFAASVGVETETLELGDGGYAWLDLLAVTPSKQRPFADAQAEVKTLAMDLERRREVAALAAKLVERLNKGESIETLAKEVGAKVEKTNPITRSTSPQGLQQSAVQQAFALAKGAAASASTPDGKGRIILRVADIIPAPAPTPEQIERLKADLTRQLQSDVLAEYVGALQTRYGLSVNQTALKQALGPEREPTVEFE